MNLWTDIGLCNGATGTIAEFIYASNQQPPNLPIAIIVKFNDYTGPSLTGLIEFQDVYQHVQSQQPVTH